MGDEWEVASMQSSLSSDHLICFRAFLWALFKNRSHPHLIMIGEFWACEGENPVEWTPIMVWDPEDRDYG